MPSMLEPSARERMKSQRVVGAPHDPQTSDALGQVGLLHDGERDVGERALSYDDEIATERARRREQCVDRVCGTRRGLRSWEVGVSHAVGAVDVVSREEPRSSGRTAPAYTGTSVRRATSNVYRALRVASCKWTFPATVPMPASATSGHRSPNSNDVTSSPAVSVSIQNRLTVGCISPSKRKAPTAG
jgi:hypothetical protein